MSEIIVKKEHVEEEIITCVYCGDRISEEDVYVFNGECYCQDCLDEISFVCEHCGERCENEENDGDDNIDVCCHCYENYYTRCVDCGRVIYYDSSRYLNDDCDGDNPYCESCYERESSIRYIHDYSYKPDPVFRGNGKRYFGVELEIDDGGKDDDNACKILDVANRECGNIYIKTDSSLSDGLEIVTHPMTLDYHLNSMPWKDICDMALKLGYMSHKTKTSGLHVHINCSAFGDTAEKQEEYIARMLYFFENNWCELLRFSRRTNAQLDRWARRYGWKEEPMDILDNAKSHCGNRYSCINIINYSTIEIRIFRGTPADTP